MQTDAKGFEMTHGLEWIRRYRRILAGSAAISGFAILFLAAKVFGTNLAIAGLSEHAVRTIAHFTGFGCLAILITTALKQRYGLGWIISVALASTEELHQLYVPGRYFTLDDLLVNALGVTVFLLAFRQLWPWTRQQILTLISHTYTNPI